MSVIAFHEKAGRSQVGCFIFSFADTFGGRDNDRSDGNALLHASSVPSSAAFDQIWMTVVAFLPIPTICRGS
jgi:hypothetical protein